MKTRTARTMAMPVVTLVGLTVLPGCLERRVSITSEPSGAAVFVNDVEFGRTPLQADFRYYGQFDVRVEKDGFEPLRTKASARAPIYEYPPIDLAAEMIPAEIETNVRWHFKLTPALETAEPAPQAEAAMIDRAKALRQRIETTK